MAEYQIERDEVVKVTRTYEVEASSPEEAIRLVKERKAKCVHEQMQETQDWDDDCTITSVDGGDPPKPKKRRAKRVP